MSEDLRHMGHALRLAARGLGQVWPNPAVGCVIVQGAVVVGRGVTAPGGRPHAETQALAQAGAQARGATAYVTLEPCAHVGQTPACAAALVQAGVACVVSALRDPDPRVNGGGHAMLRAAGVTVREGVMEAQARAVQHGFLTRIAHGRPMVTLKLAASLDGRIATSRGESRWITGEQARHRVHLMRATHDAVLVGGGTARTDDPQLTVRGFGARRQPVRVIAAAGLDLPRNGRFEASVPDAPVWLIHASDAPEDRRSFWQGLGARLLEVPRDSTGGLDPAALVQALGREGLTRVMCEGGGALGAALLRAGLVDRLAVFHAGLTLGSDAVGALAGMGIERLADAPRFGQVRAQAAGADLLSEWARLP